MRRSLAKISLFVLGLSVFFTGGAMATPFNPAGASVTQMSEVQGVFEAIGSSINANTDETQSEAFAPQSSGATAEYVATVSYFWNTLEFGFYEIGNITNKLMLFNKDTISSLPGDSTQIYLDFSGDTFQSYSFAGGYHVIDSATYMNQLGFYGIGDEGTAFYSESSLNNNGYDRFLTYEGKGDSVDVLGDSNYLNDTAHWYIAAELGSYSTDDPTVGDFSDIIVQLESVQPVPEPGTLLLLGSGLIGLAFLKRRKQA